MSEQEIVHKPVMWREVLEFASGIIGKGENIFVDCTTGEGGHSELLLETYKKLNIIAIERDAEILEIAKGRLGNYKNRIELINDNFSNIAGHLQNMKGGISGFLYDFGISSYHFEKSGRGFSLSAEEPLDMRLDINCKLNAGYVVNKYPEDRLCKIFFEYGEERWAKRIARDICAKRREKPVESSAELAEITRKSIPARYRVKNIHPATRIFQAIRIEVNDELSAIRESLKEAYMLLAEGGIIMAISFHSLEDRIVKEEFRRLARGCVCTLPVRECRCSGEPLVEVLTKKPLLPKDDEIRENRRSRSAKLRACRKLW